MAKIRPAERRKRVEEAARILNLTEYHGQAQGTPSGGRRQRVAVIEDGYLQQVDAPLNLYEKPVSLFVANIVGRVSGRGAVHTSELIHVTTHASSVHVCAWGVVGAPGR